MVVLPVETKGSKDPSGRARQCGITENFAQAQNSEQKKDLGADEDEKVGCEKQDPFLSLQANAHAG
jgi:hypothetical protein